MAAIETDVRHKIADSLGDTVLRDIIDAQDIYNASAVKFVEAHGVTVDEDEDQWRKLTGDSNRDLSPMTRERSMKLALYLWESNLLANRIIELPIAYMLAEGVKLKSDNEVVQDILDKFWDDPINAMDLKLPKKCRELSLFGMQFWPAFVNEMTGHVRLGYLDPALVQTVVTDPGNSELPIGVVTKKDSKGRSRKYKVIINGDEDDLFTQRTREIREDFTDGELFYFPINDISNGKFGRSDLLAQIDWLDAYDQFMYGELDRAQDLRAFNYDVTMKGATPDEVTARAKQITRPGPRSVRVHNDSEVWETLTPDLNASDGNETARLFRNNILGGATLPETWYGGGGDVNRSTADAMGDPTFKMFSMRQRYLGYILKTVGCYVVRQWMLANGDIVDDNVMDMIEVEFPEMVTKDTTKYASALQQVTVSVGLAIDRGIMTSKTGVNIIRNISARLGVEYDVDEELKNAVAEAGKRNEEDVFTDPPDDDSVDDPD